MGWIILGIFGVGVIALMLFVWFVENENKLTWPQIILIGLLVAFLTSFFY